MRYLRPIIKNIFAGNKVAVPTEKRWRIKIVHVSNGTGVGYCCANLHDQSDAVVLASNTQGQVYNGATVETYLNKNTVYMDLFLRPKDELEAVGDDATVWIDEYSDD